VRPEVHDAAVAVRNDSGDAGAVEFGPSILRLNCLLEVAGSDEFGPVLIDPAVPYRFTSSIATGARSDSPMGSATSFSQPKRARLSASKASS